MCCVYQLDLLNIMFCEDQIFVGLGNIEQIVFFGMLEMLEVGVFEVVVKNVFELCKKYNMLQFVMVYM